MGKWAEVHCACPNRVPLPGSDFYFDRPHRNKRRLTKKEKEEVEEWERTTKDMFDCGHRGGLVIELWPGDIIQLGYLLGHLFRDEVSTYEVFARVGDWRNYDDELLLIQPKDAELWLLEIEDIQQGFQGVRSLPLTKIERLILELYREDLGSRLDLERRLDEVEAITASGLIASMKRNVHQSQHPDIESTVEKMMAALSNAAKLCDWSIKTGNPIRLLW